MRAPSFRCTEEPDGSLILHYYSERPGLEHIVIGIVKVKSQKTEKKNSTATNDSRLKNLINTIFLLRPFHVQAVASKLHGVEVDIKIIKRKGDPIISLDAENNCKYFETQQTRNCTANIFDTNVNNNNNTQVPTKEKCEHLAFLWDTD